MQQYVDAIISGTDYSVSCHGIQAVNAAEKIMQYYFTVENIPVKGWAVREIPVADGSGEYPVAVVLCVCNRAEHQEITLNIARNGSLNSCCPDQQAEIYLNTIKEALEHPASRY